MIEYNGRVFNFLPVCELLKVAMENRLANCNVDILVDRPKSECPVEASVLFARFLVKYIGRVRSFDKLLSE